MARQRPTLHESGVFRISATTAARWLGELTGVSVGRVSKQTKQTADTGGYKRGTKSPSPTRNAELFTTVMEQLADGEPDPARCHGQGLDDRVFANKPDGED